MCDFADEPGGRETAMVVVAPGVHCDPCIAPIVRALNASTELPSFPTVHGDEPIRTVASCCGHGRRPSRITLADGRELLVMSQKDVDRVGHMWPDINDPMEASDA